MNKFKFGITQEGKLIAAFLHEGNRDRFLDVLQDDFVGDCAAVELEED